MKKIIPFLFILFFISCKKSDNTPINVTPNVILLKKFVVVDTTKTPPYDSINIYRFNYDSQNRLIQSILDRYDAATSTKKTIRSFTYSYNGADTTPYKIVEGDAFMSNGAPFTQVHYLFYNAQGKMVKDSNTLTVGAPSNYSSKSTDEFQYLTNSIREIYTDWNNNGSVTTNVFPQTLDANSNVVSEQINYNTFTALYENSLNPLYKLDPEKYPLLQNYSFFTYIEFDNMFSLTTPQRNNFSKVTRVYNSGSGSNTFYTEYFYEYGANGYPTLLRCKTSNNPTAFDKKKYLYFY